MPSALVFGSIYATSVYMLSLILNLLFILPTSASDNLSVQRSQNESILLEGPCFEVKLAVDGINRWNTASSNCQMIRQAKNNCRSEISHCLPDFVNKVHGKYSKALGPNCFNLAFLSTNLNSDLRLINEEEANHLLDSKCVQITKDNRLPGDVGILYEDNELMHGFVWISENFVFTKNGASEGIPYELSTWQKLKDFYHFIEGNDKSDYYDYSAYLSQFPDVPKTKYTSPGELRYYRCQSGGHPPFAFTDQIERLTESCTNCAQPQPAVVSQ